jgi:hypothetical protein
MPQQTLQIFNYAKPIAKSDTVFSPTMPPGGTGAGGRYPDAIWVGGAGVVACIFDDGSEVDITVTAGTILPIRCARVNNTTTTATLLVGMWQL